MRPKHYDLYPSDDNTYWLYTLGDMTTLLLTFFVFLIGISVFVTDDAYRRFWKAFDAEQGKTKAAAQSFRFPLIAGLRMPHLSAEAEHMLDDITEFLEKGDYKGIDLFYSESKLALMVSEELAFPSGQDTMTARMQQLLQGLVPALQRVPYTVKIEGHSDALSTPRIDNMELSLQRALRVARFLVSAGLDAKRVAVSGYGDTRPLNNDNTDKGYAQNRRVEIHVSIPHAGG
jgi:chemotaxis protein MotB